MSTPTRTGATQVWIRGAEGYETRKLKRQLKQFGAVWNASEKAWRTSDAGRLKVLAALARTDRLTYDVDRNGAGAGDGGNNVRIFFRTTASESPGRATAKPATATAKRRRLTQPAHGGGGGGQGAAEGPKTRRSRTPPPPPPPLPEERKTHRSRTPSPPPSPPPPRRPKEQKARRSRTPSPPPPASGATKTALLAKVAKDELVEWLHDRDEEKQTLGFFRAQPVAALRRQVERAATLSDARALASLSGARAAGKRTDKRRRLANAVALLSATARRLRPGTRFRVALEVADPHGRGNVAWGGPVEVEVVEYKRDPEYDAAKDLTPSAWTWLVVRTLDGFGVPGGVVLRYSLGGDPLAWTTRSSDLNPDAEVYSTVRTSDLLAITTAAREHEQ